MSNGKRQPGPEPIVVGDDSAEIKISRDARTDLYNTFRVGGPADYLVRAGRYEGIRLALDWASQHDLPVTVFGGGSNLLVGPGGIRGLALVVRRSGRDAESDLEILDEDETGVRVRIPAAAPLSWLGRTASERGWRGMTWAVGLPGNVGGAAVNNAGAHGTEMKDHLLSLRALDLSGRVHEWDRGWLEPSYRRTKLKAAGNPREQIVLDVTLRLERGDSDALKTEAEEFGNYRHQSQPTGACAGSIFKNPEGTYSGLVIEQLGLKGTRVGGAVVSDKHANFIVNDDGATPNDIVDLIEVVQANVREQSGILLSPEIERIGEW